MPCHKHHNLKWLEKLLVLISKTVVSSKVVLVFFPHGFLLFLCVCLVLREKAKLLAQTFTIFF